MTKPRLLDLFCKAGGAGMGYAQAGFDVTGVDIEPQPRYPFPFVQDDALSYVVKHGAEYDFIHASPPCQAFTVAQSMHGNEHEDLLTPTRSLLEKTGKPWVIENVPGAPMRRDLMLCGTMFDLRVKEGKLKRHRWFEFGFPFFALTPPHCWRRGPTVRVFGHGGDVYHSVGVWRAVMGIEWMNVAELAQAIPPAYTRFIGTHVRAVLDTPPAAVVGTQET